MPDWIARKDIQPEGRPSIPATGGFSQVTTDCKVDHLCEDRAGAMRLRCSQLSITGTGAT